MLKFSDSTIVRESDDGALMLDTRRGTYWHLNETGLRLVRAVRAGKSVDDVASEIAREHGVERTVVRNDLDSLIADMKRAKLLSGRV
ncbi:lasso peptide biosynthesis PqqD family chaperone [Actinomyces respiraculi]|uniref:lasso peptide biosynthesis PqqD family chaperone n=1 Tax=Actinomyces respiraculi TaxID=2744574 RepID=UPI00141D8727|nr:lasso peptide biosynthesis PqqD family chaperone [Actinomyces respiraculi]